MTIGKIKLEWLENEFVGNPNKLTFSMEQVIPSVARGMLTWVQSGLRDSTITWTVRVHASFPG